MQKLTPVFKAGEKDDLSNYNPISALPSFSKMLERIMYNCLYDHPQDKKIIYPEQFGFQIRHSTDVVAIQLVDQIREVFEQNQVTL